MPLGVVVDSCHAGDELMIARLRGAVGGAVLEPLGLKPAVH